MSGLYYLESYSSKTEMPLLVSLAIKLSHRLGNEEVVVIGEEQILGSNTGLRLDGFVITGDVVESLPVDSLIDFRRYCNEALANDSYLLISTQNRASEYYFGKESLPERPNYSAVNSFFINRPESLMAINNKAIESKEEMVSEPIFDKDRTFIIGYEVSERDTIDEIFKRIKDLIVPIAKRSLPAPVTQLRPENKEGKETYVTEILMSKTNPDGIPLEVLLESLVNELQVKQSYLAGDHSMAAEVVKKNNEATINFLRECAKLQNLNRKVLDNISADKGPTGNPRIGTL